MIRKRRNTKHRDKFGNVVFKPGDRCRWRGETFTVVEGNTPEGSILVRSAGGGLSWLGLSTDVEKLRTVKPRAVRKTRR